VKGRTVILILGALLVVIVVVMVSISLSSGTKTEKGKIEVTSIESIPDNYWEELPEKKIFFLAINQSVKT